MRKKSLQNAQQGLVLFQEGKVDSFSLFVLLKQHLDNGDFTLNELGITDVDLEVLRVDGLKVRAKECIEVICSAAWPIIVLELLTDLLDYMMKDGGLTKEDVSLPYLLDINQFGLVQSDGKDKRPEYFRMRAEKCVRVIRHPACSVQLFSLLVECLDYMAKKGRFTKEDVGITEAELGELLHRLRK